MAILLKVKWVNQPGKPEQHQIRYIGGDSRVLQRKHKDTVSTGFISRGLLAYTAGKDARILNQMPGRTTDVENI
jgi:hypothetical protein